MPEHMMIYEKNAEQDDLNRKLFDLLQESNAVDLSNWLDEYVVIGGNYKPCTTKSVFIH